MMVLEEEGGLPKGYTSSRGGPRGGRGVRGMMGARGGAGGMSSRGSGMMGGGMRGGMGTRGNRRIWLSGRFYNPAVNMTC